MITITRMLTWVVSVTCLGLTVAGETLWQVGEFDNNTAEFTHAPKDYQAYKRPAFFIVGVSDPRTDWPYVQPGMVDGGWAPGTPQTYEVLFGLAAVPDGACRLVLDFADTHAVAPPALRVAVNDSTWDFATPRGAGDASVYGDPSKGREHLIEVTVPANALRAGENCLAITTVRGSWVLWDAVRFEAPAGTTLTAIEDRTTIRSVTSEASVLVWHEGKEAQVIRLEVMHIGDDVEAEVAVGSVKMSVRLTRGTQRVDIPVPPVSASTPRRVSLSPKGRPPVETTVAIDPVRRWELHIVHQTHLDIGYTHTQEDVLKLQVEWLRRAMQYIEKSKEYPEAAQFKWHPEGMWAVDEFMRTAGDEEKAGFVEVCRKGQVHLDVLYAQAMTGMYNEEELMELMGAAKRFEKQFGVPVISAMQSDVPGYTWGLATALAHCGVPYMSVGPNGGHRIGHTFACGDRPFWWVNPSGKHKVLFWMCGGGYFGLRDAREDAILAVLQRLEAKGYPFEMAMVRMLSGGDNAPPNPSLSDEVQAWNKRYASPKLVISRNSEFLKEFGEVYGDELPVVSGDFTPYWEDGSASTAKATAANRQACETIVQAQILWAMLAPELKLHERFDAAWNKMIMYDEHTWGAHNSISRPDDLFAVQQDEYKQAYAFDGYGLTDELLRDVTQTVAKERSSTIDVYNTAARDRSGLVLLSREQSVAGDSVKDSDGTSVRSQRLSSGELAFVARKIPAFGARRYSVHSGAPQAVGTARANGATLANEQLSLEIDKQTGAIRTLKCRGMDANLVETGTSAGLNDYLYIIGRDPEQNRSTVQGPVTLVVEDRGPVVATLRIESDAPGCRTLTRRVRVVDGLGYVELINTTDKLKERRPEGVYFGFPFNIPGAVSRVDVPWAVVQVEKDQMEGANRNFYCVQRWVDLSNADYGVTWITLDAPMMQFDPIKIALASGSKWWRTRIEPGAHIYSWAMNNHWETNYKADQEGLITLRYALAPHVGGYDAAEAQRVARALHQPLLAVAVDSAKPVIKPLLQAVPEGIIVSSMRPSRDGKATMLRLFNTADRAQHVRLAWNGDVGGTWISNPMEDAVKPAPDTIEMVRFEVVTVRVERPL